MTSRRSSVSTMWKVILLLAFMASLSIIYCDDSSNDDCQDAETDSINSSSTEFLSSSSTSSSYSSMTSSSSSESSYSKGLSKKRRNNDSGDDSGLSSNDTSGSGSSDVDTTTQGATDTNVSDDKANDDSSGADALSYKCGTNEVFSNCTNGGCDARNCSQAGKPVRCVKLDPKSCIKGCVCQPDYLRASNGTCVPKNQCDQGCGDDPNAHPGCGVNCGRTCSTYKTKNAICTLICNLNGCDCNEGYVHDPAVNKCVLPDDCTPVCGANEIVSTCANGGCGPWTCADLGTPVKCVRPIKCQKGCVCQNEYVRNDNGTCVPKDQCQGGCGGDPNAKPGCGVNCGRTCATYKSPNVACPAICKLNGCDCKDGYVFDDNVQKCVLPQECSGTSGCGGDPNAKPGCGVNCGRTCTTYKSPNVACPAICKVGGCDCKDGYVFDDKVKKCVLPQDCSGTTPPSDQCPGQNEFFDTCISGCSNQTCETIGKVFHCPIQPAVCRTGCRCKPGFYRNAANICVSESECQSCGGDKNAKPGCGVNCGKTCAKNQICPRICKAGGCDCKDGFLFDANLQKCVLPKECTPICGLNEMYDGCTNGGCGHRNCSQLGQPQICVDVIESYCIKGCRCTDGYLRAANGTCIPQDQCPAPESCGGDKNAKPGCGVNCGKTCAKNRICPRICKVGGCDCKDGYLFDANLQKCVVPEKCTPICGLNEMYDACTNGGCGHRNCSQLGQPQICVDVIESSCIKGCRCTDGYLRAANGTCIPQDQCPAPGCGGDPNAEKGCGFNCGRTCSSYKIENISLLCPRIQCKPDRCDCKDGYVFDDNLKKCVLPEQCTPICGLNEMYDDCINGGCGHRNCSQLGQPQICVDVIEGSCIKGCRCTDGYLRAANGTCIPQDQCPALGCGGDPNARMGCGYNCGRKCSTYKIKNKSLLCPHIPCKPDRCDCKDGYVFDDNLKKCVLPEQCTPICGLNEKYDACTNGGCGRRNCSQLGKPVPCIDPVPGACIKGCRCTDGYLRAANGTCIPQDQCPVPAKCDKPNEVYDVCPAPCPPKLCNVNEAVIRCKAPPKPGDPECQPGCRCADTYYRNATGTCVPKKKCEKPLKCNRPNEVYDACPAICPPQECGVNPALILCLPNPVYGSPNCKPSCVCADGYVRNYAKECIPRDKCPPPSDQCTGQNEFFDTCISGCSNQTCASIGQIYNCPIQPAVCRTGCRCKPGFYRNEDNVCVPESECPSPPCPEGETYSRCPTVKCEGDYCPKTRNSPLTCPVGIVCDKPRCVCGFNRRRDQKTGKCIFNDDCPPFKCDGPNEEYKACPATCPGESCSDYINSTKCPPFGIDIVVPCKPQCKCKQGYYRNSNGICILGSQCGPKVSTTTVPIETPATAAPPATTTSAPTTADGGDNNSGDAKTGLAKLKAGVTAFTGKFLYDRMKAGNGQNIIASPFSVFTPMAQLALFADGECLKQLTSVLNVPSKNDLRAAFPVLAASFDGQTSVNFSTAAKVYSNENYPLSDTFIRESALFKAEAEELNFNAPAQAANIINNWVSNKTNNLIKDLIQASDLNSLTRLVLVNAIYFKGEWLRAFDPKNTKDADFYLSDGTTKKTKLMYQEGQFNYGNVPELNCTVLEMFYKGNNFSMLWVLPNEKDGVMTTAKNLQNPANMNKILGSMRSEKVKVYVPPMEINTSTDLADILKQEGVTKIFDQNDSGLSGMLKKPDDIYVSKAIQKAVIKVDEKGSEAAAANGVIVSTRAIPKPPADPIVFRADHPFLFYIRAQGTTMFCGAFVQ